jgi:hypothetical protein
VSLVALVLKPVFRLVLAITGDDILSCRDILAFYARLGIIWK